MQELGEMLDTWDAATLHRHVERIKACTEIGVIHLDRVFNPKWYTRDSKEIPE